MSLFVRKIEFNKWNQNNILEGEEPSADAITNCMKTRGNTLSLWLINDDGELEDAVLAIASQFDQLDSIDILTIEPRLIQNSGLNLNNTEGITPYKPFSQRHHDLADLNYSSLGVVANMIIKSIKDDRNRRFTKSKLKKIISDGLQNGKVNLENLHPNIQDKIQKQKSCQNP